MICPLVDVVEGCYSITVLHMIKQWQAVLGPITEAEQHDGIRVRLKPMIVRVYAPIVWQPHPP